MSTDYAYDEQGQFFPYFILTISGLITFPLTYSLLKPNKDLENTAPRIKSDFHPPDEDLIQRQKRKQWRRERRIKRFITVVAGYATMGLMVYLIIVTAATVPKIWDPYEILGLSRSANEQQVKRKYRDLSLKLHPDRARPDESKNQTIETINDHWVEVSKAYKALTDEEVRNNYQLYGHPDGKQSLSIGIALPKFIVTEGNGKYVLLVYGILLGVLLPYVVGKWWYGTQKMTREKVLIPSAGNLFKEYKEDIAESGVINALSAGEEYKEVLKGSKVDAGLAKSESKILEETSRNTTVAGLSATDKTRLQGFEGIRRKAQTLLWAYLGRVPLSDRTLDDEKFEIAPIALSQLESLIAITTAFGNTSPLLSAYRISQSLIQAMPPNASPLLQLPHINPTLAAHITGPSRQPSYSSMSIQQFMALPEHRRRKLCTDTPNAPQLTPAQYNTAINVARQLPFLKVEKAFFKVTGERAINPSSLVQLVLKARIIPPGSTNIPPINPSDLEDVDPDEGDVDALLGRAPKTGKTRHKRSDSKLLSSSQESPTDALPKSDPAVDNTPLQPPLTHAPYFPRDHSPRWRVFLADGKMGKIAVPPFTLTTFNKPLINAESGEPTFNMQTLKMQFQAPPQVGKYPFVMHVVSDSYVGMDSQLEVVLEVEEVRAVDIEESEDEISEPEEDSIAGQMNALKSGTLGAPPRANKPKRKFAAQKKKQELEESSDDDESDTEGEAEDTSETDTDTDTDGE